MLVDFAEWASPTLDLVLGGRTYSVRPPSVGQAPAILACAIRSEISLGMVDGPLPDEMTELLARVADTPLGVISLGQDVYGQMVADQVPGVDVDRAAYYAVHFWARGKTQADLIAQLLWSTGTGSGDVAGPKAPAASTSGPSTGSGRSTRRRASTRTTGSHQS